jgi:hypothetical protein
MSPAGREALMNVAELRSKIATAKRRLMTAESEMETALHGLGHAPRVDKSIISGALSTAFTELKAARQDLGDLEQVLAEE